MLNEDNGTRWIEGADLLSINTKEAYIKELVIPYKDSYYDGYVDEVDKILIEMELFQMERDYYNDLQNANNTNSQYLLAEEDWQDCDIYIDTENFPLKMEDVPVIDPFSISRDVDDFIKRVKGGE